VSECGGIAEPELTVCLSEIRDDGCDVGTLEHLGACTHDRLCKR
jgi:hypothetical protein